MKKILLASKSPRRKQLLEWAEIPFEVVVEETDESYPTDLSINEVPVFIARNKAIAVKKVIVGEDQKNLQTILAADTVVIINNQILGKPADRIEAIEMLCQLSGKKHVVTTGIAIFHGEKEITFSDSTEVKFHKLRNDQIAFYVDKYHPYDKAGGYAIQEWIGVVGIKSIHGDFYNVMGLPVSRVVQELNNLQDN